MTDRHTTLYINDISPVNFCGKTIAWQMDTDGAYEKPFKTTPTKGEHDYKTCDGCQSVLKELVKRLTDKFEGSGQKKAFPLCCNGHANLNDLIEFDRASFVGTPEMVSNKILYTNQHIINFHVKENYYKEITDYIDYTVESFGQMPTKCGEPLFLSDYFYYVLDLLENNKGIPKEKKNTITDFLKAYQTPSESQKTDLNILLATYQKWLKIFPFEISYFTRLKEHYEKRLPILNGKPEVNKYLGTAKGKVHTKQGLITVLLNLTNKLLTDINSHSLYEEGLLTEPQKIKLELVLNERRLKLKQGYINKSKDEEKQYRKILKDWFADEKKFIDEVTPLLEEVPPKANEKKPFSVDNFKYSSDAYLMPEDDFRAMIVKRYGDKYLPNELDQIFKKYQTENTATKRQEAQEIVNAKAYINSLYNYEGFKKSMGDSNSDRYYTDLNNNWVESQKKYIEESGLQEVSKGLDFLFSTYLGHIFSIYKHAFNYHEKNSIKDMKQIALKRARFDCLINEQTDHFIANLKSEKVKGNYKLVIDRKDYVLGLFGSLEKFLANASINFNKSPFKGVFDISKEKIENAVSFDEVKFLAVQSGNRNSEIHPEPKNNGETKLSINQIALKYSYEGLQITRQNGNKIAEEYGHKSGEKLFQRFTYYSNPTNRKGKPMPCTLKKLKNKINLLNSVIEILPSDKKARATDEVKILKIIFEDEFQ